MKFTPHHRQILRAILNGSYTPLDVREFVQFCYLLALPLVRSKIRGGKLSLDVLGLHEIDVVYDCLAELFRRDSEGVFIHVKSYFESQQIDPAVSHEDELLVTLRRLVFGRVHCSLIRLYSEADPALGKVLRNVTLELDRSSLFEHQARFGETYLMVKDSDPCLHLPPSPPDIIRQRFSQVVSVRDTIPVMLEKLHTILVSQSEFRRAIPLVTAGLLFKDAYAVAAVVEEAETSTAEQQAEQDDVLRIADIVCKSIAAEARTSYVAKGKRSAEIVDKYIDTVKEILLGEFGSGRSDGVSYYDHLKARIPGMTKAIYARKHRTVLEYLAKQAKNRMRQELRRA